MSGTILIIISVILLAVISVLFEHFKTRRIMDSLNKMLDTAIDGSFQEHHFEESLLSAVESRMNQYLSASEVSARNLAEEKDSIKQLIADISHQTKLPIANILLYTQLLEEQELTEDCRGYVLAQHVQAEKLSFLITALVKLSRLETGIMALHPSPALLAPMLEELQLQFQSKAKEKEISLTFEAPEKAEAVFDAKWTAEAVGNLIDNAVKYTPAQGKVAVRVMPYQLFCRIDVIDSGAGIPEEELSKVFTRFYRSRQNDKEEGVGLGLYLARQILSEEGGYIKASSKPGAGSTFSAFLPRSS